jgi:hypothetical protein
MAVWKKVTTRHGETLINLDNVPMNSERLGRPGPDEERITPLVDQPTDLLVVRKPHDKARALPQLYGLPLVS